MKKITLSFCVMLFGYFTASAQYCIPAIDCTDGDLILNVEFAGINNSSDCTVGGYTDFTTVDPAEVEPGLTYSMSVQVGSGWSSETVGVWIDFDNNESFDPSEFYLLGTGSGSIVTNDITIPSDVTEGTYRMRISVVASPDPIEDPCLIEPTNYGEFEDYLVNVSVLSLQDVNINGFNYFYSPQTKNLTLTANDSFSSVNIFNILGQEVVSQKLSATNEVINLSSLKNGVYLANVAANGQTTTVKIVKR